MSRDSEIKSVNWDLVVIDEAHRLRNVYKPQNKIANAIKEAVYNFPKVLLTATPLQNSLLEFYGLVSIIDDHTFGDLKSFKSQFAKLTGGNSFDDLKRQLEPICIRALRRQVLEYIKCTNRIPYTGIHSHRKRAEALQSCFRLPSDVGTLRLPLLRPRILLS
jgi:SNF2 family DNA or RNA helicase